MASVLPMVIPPPSSAKICSSLGFMEDIRLVEVLALLGGCLSGWFGHNCINGSTEVSAAGFSIGNGHAALEVGEEGRSLV
jgi:hypothetical protein